MKPHIVIIGAGIAGLAAANALTQNDFQVTVVEGRKRLGGRINTDYSWGIPLDLGAAFIHGNINNPIAELAETCHLRSVALDPSQPYNLFDHPYKMISSEQFIKSETAFFSLLEKIKNIAQAAKKDFSLLDAFKMIAPSSIDPLLLWRFTRLSGYIGMDAQFVSAKYWDQEETLPGGNYFLLSGYAPIIQYLAKGVKIITDSAVKSIDYRNKLIKVATTKNSLTADAVIITLPLGVLKNNTVKFIPALPKEKQAAIQNLGMGVMNKIVLKFAKRFWPEHYSPFIGQLRQSYNDIFAFMNLDIYFQQPILAGLLFGEAAIHSEKLTDAAMVKKAVKQLHELFGEKIPAPEAYKITRWASNPFSHGSYSYIPVGATSEDCAMLAEPMDQRLFFAGEATHSQYLGTTHGAYLSGIREVNHIAQ